MNTPKPARGRILTYRTDRLGLRLQNLILGQRMGDVFNAEVLHLWTIRANAPELANPKDLFSADFVDQTFVLDSARQADLVEHANNLRSFTNTQDMRACLDAGTDIVVIGLPEDIPPSLPGEPPETAAAAFQHYARRLPINPQLQARAKAQFTRLETGEVHALHIRRGDIIHKPIFSKSFWPTKYVPDAYYDAVISAHPDRDYLLFTDTPQTRVRYRAAYGIPAAADILDQTGLTEAQSALLEIMTIARCKRVIAGSDSGFSSVAARFGGVERYSLPGSMPDALRETAENAVLASVAAGPDGFINVQDFGQAAHWAVNILRARGQDTEAQTIVRDVIANGHSIVHLTQNALAQAVRDHDDSTVLHLMRARNGETRYIFAANRTPQHARKQVPRYVLSAQAFAGQDKPDLAIQALLCAAVIQSAPGSLDLLSGRLAKELSQGAAGAPPTTLLKRGPRHPVPPTGRLRRHFAPLSDRFMRGTDLYHWETALQLDWAPLLVRGGYDPAPKTLKLIAKDGQQGGPMMRSLAAMALLRGDDLDGAQRLLPPMDHDVAQLDKTAAALLHKRVATLALARDRFQEAEHAMQRCFTLSPHPAFATWWAWAEWQAGRPEDAAERLCAIPDKPIYTRIMLLDLVRQAGLTGFDNGALKKDVRQLLWVPAPDQPSQPQYSAPASTPIQLQNRS